MDNKPFETESDQPDQRSEYRLTGRATVALELEAADPDSGRSERMVTFQTKDLSLHGIRLETSEPVQVGALLPATVCLDTSNETFQLVTEVIWCQAQGDARWAVGLKVVESDETSLLDWLEALATALSGE